MTSKLIEAQVSNDDVAIFSQKLADTLKFTRKMLNVTQDELAEAIGMAKSHVSYLETGDRLPSITTLLRIAKVTGTTLSITFLLKE